MPSLRPRPQEQLEDVSAGCEAGPPQSCSARLEIGEGAFKPAATKACLPGRLPRPLEAVEDKVEAVLELVPVVVAGLHGMFGDELDEIGVLIG